MVDGARPWWSAPVRAWAVSRLVVLAAALVAVPLLGVPSRGVEPAVPEPLAYLGAWDTTWYLDIARHGYAVDGPAVGVEFTNLAFFPALPLLMAAIERIGANPFLITVALGQLAFLGAVLGVHRLAEPRWGRQVADHSAWAIALAPPSVVASMAYTEAFMVCGAVGAALLATRGAWLTAGLVSGPVALLRPTGGLVAVLVVAMALSTPGPWPRRAVRAAAGAVPSLTALLVFAAWMERERGSWMLPIEAQGAWDRGAPVLGIVTHLPHELWDIARGVALVDRNAQITASLRDVLFLALYVVLVVHLARMVGARSPWVWYAALALAVPFASGSVESMARFGFVAFPLAWPAGRWLAGVDDRRRRHLAAAAVLLTVLMVWQLRIRAP